MWMQSLSLFVLTLSIVNFQFAITESTSINILVLVPWPDSREYAGWDVGLELLPGSRIAVEEINNRTDMLTGYRINIIEAGHDACGLTEHSLGLTNLVRESVEPFRNVLAVLGLFCSSNTLALSPVAGRMGVDLIQIAGSYSPIFKQNTNRFPHLWRLIQSADVHAKLMIHLAKQYDWSRIAIVTNTENAFYSGIATSLVNELERENNNGSNFEIIYQGSLVKRIDTFKLQVLTDLVSINARIVFLSAESGQIADFLCAAFRRDMLYPNYLWVVVDWTLNALLREKDVSCSEGELRSVLEGSVSSYFYFLPSANDTYTLFRDNYYRKLENIKEQYEKLIEETNANITDGDLEYASVLYHQVYAISYALNNSLPKLKANNISIEKYGFGQPEVTAIIEESLRETFFTGFTGKISFNRYNEVDTPLNVFQVVEGISVVVGRLPGASNFTGRLNITFDPRLDDSIPSLYRTINSYLTGLLTLLVIVFFVIVTVLLFLVVKYRNVKQIKANSVKVSMLMYIACYIFIAADIIIIILCSVQLTVVVYSALCNIMYFLIYNAFILLFSTQLVKQRRIHRIFNNTSFKVYSWRYSNWMVALKIISFCLVGDIIWLINISIQPAHQKFTETIESYEGTTTKFIYPYCDAGISDYLFYFLYLYLAILLFLNIYLASRAKKTMQQDFRNTKLINLCMVVVFIILFLSVPFREVFFINNKYVIYLNVVIFFCTLIPAALSQLILFLPSILRTLRDKRVFQSNFVSRASLQPIM